MDISHAQNTRKGRDLHLGEAVQGVRSLRQDARGRRASLQQQAGQKVPESKGDSVRFIESISSGI